MCWPKGKAERRYAGVTHLDVSDLDVAATSALCEKYGVEISALGYYPNPLCADEAEAAVYIAHLLKVIDAAKVLGIGQVDTFLGRDPRKSIQDNWPRFLAVWPAIVQHAEQQNVRIGIENCPMYFSHDEWPSGKNLAISPSVWRKMFADIPSENFGLNYDPSHLVWQFMDHVAPLWEFSEKLLQIHAKDVRIDRHRLNDVGITATPLEFHRPKLPGLGEIDWGRFFSVLRDVDYQGHVVVEVEDRAYEHSLDGRKAALRQSLRFLKSFV
jgi:sugar phosphate isomerase/epimerase